MPNEEFDIKRISAGFDEIAVRYKGAESRAALHKFALEEFAKIKPNDDYSNLEAVASQKRALYNKYREIWHFNHLGFRLNLSRADLAFADLSGAILSRADLTYADLTYADLSDAHLTGANLFHADLTGADLIRINLSRAILSGANLSDTDLSGAILTYANLSRAILAGANLIYADLAGTNLAGAITVGIYASFQDGEITFDITQTNNLTQAQLDSSIRTSKELVSAIGGILGLPDAAITGEYLEKLPNLYIAAKSCSELTDKERKYKAEKAKAKESGSAIMMDGQPIDEQIQGTIEAQIKQKAVLTQKAVQMWEDFPQTLSCAAFKESLPENAIATIQALGQVRDGINERSAELIYSELEPKEKLARLARVNKRVKTTTVDGKKTVKKCGVYVKDLLQKEAMAQIGGYLLYDNRKIETDKNGYIIPHKTAKTGGLTGAEAQTAATGVIIHGKTSFREAVASKRENRILKGLVTEKAVHKSAMVEILAGNFKLNSPEGERARC